MNTVETQPLYGWSTLNWKTIERRGCKLHTRIYRAPRGGRPPQVCMTSTRLLRSRVKGNFHARFCSRARVATPWLRQP